MAQMVWIKARLGQRLENLSGPPANFFSGAVALHVSNALEASDYDV